MSLLFEKQSLAVLAVAHGAVVSIRDNFDLGIQFQGLLAKCNRALAAAGKEWPLPADQNSRALPWVRERLALWSKKDARVDSGWRIIALGAMAITAVTDRHEASAEKLRKARLDSERAYYQKQCNLLDPIFSTLDELVSFIDKRGAQTEILEETTDLLEKLYKILEVPR